ncbi:MAG: hypothetical protein J5532_00540 [Lachnospiraceae bacterium]|nr:hypothetical protein [Lachnospiraceae bacterium]
MIGVLALFQYFLTGFAVVAAVIPRTMQKKILTTTGEHSRNPVFSLFPAVWIAGFLVNTWAVYLVAWLFRNTERPLVYANAVVMPVLSVLSVFLIIRAGRHVRYRALLKSLRPTPREMLFLALSVSFAAVMMIASFRVVKGNIVVGGPVIGDFTLHLAVIRSFSVWQKIPAEFPLFAGAGGMNYHFLFDFAAGNLELLGLRIDLAFNVPAVLSMVAMYCAIYEVFFRLCGRKNVAVPVWLMVTFRSSYGMIRFLTENAGGLSKAFSENETYIGATEYESWGLYQVNALMNQRHLLFGIATAFFIVSLFLPYLIKGTAERTVIFAKSAGAGYRREVFRKHFRISGRSAMLTAVFSGVALGLVGYVSVHSLIAALLILFALAWFSAEQPAYILTAGISVAIFAVSHLAFAGGAGAVSLTHGYVLENRGVLGLLGFAWKWIFLLIPLLVYYLYRAGKAQRVFLAASVLLIVFAFCVSISQSMLQNHKFLLISLYLLEAQGAIGISYLLEPMKSTRLTTLRRALTVVLFVPLTATGIYDTYLALYKCDTGRSYLIENKPGIISAAEEYGASKEDIYAVPGPVCFDFIAGGFSQYLAASVLVSGAGYEAEERARVLTKISLAQDALSMREAAAEAGISYLVLTNRTFAQYPGFQSGIAEDAFVRVYTKEDGSQTYTVYDTGYRAGKQ